MTAMLRGPVMHLSNKIWFHGFILLVLLRWSEHVAPLWHLPAICIQIWITEYGVFLFLDFPLPPLIPHFCLFFFFCIDAKLAQMWPDFHWEQDGCLCKAFWNGWVASVWKEFWREVFYLTHHQRSSETNKLKYTITAEIKLKIKNWVTVKQRGFRSIYWPCVRKSRSVPTPLAPSCGKLFTRSSFKIGPPPPCEALEVAVKL